MYYLPPSHFSRYIRRGNLHPDISARCSDPKLGFVIGKCPEAHIRDMSFPKIYPQAAMYGVRLEKLILKQHDVKNNQWTDSPRKMLWLQSPQKN